MEGFVENITKCDVVVINYPFSSGSGSKTRPALVIVESGNEIIVCAITSKSGRKNEVKLEDHDFKIGKLPLISYIRPNSIFTTKKNTVIKKSGSLKGEKVNEVIAQVIEILSQPPNPVQSLSKALERSDRTKRQD